MTDGISRRKVLGSVGAVGAAGLAGGAGINALLLDEETFDGNLFGSGEFDLTAGWNEPRTHDLSVDLSKQSSGSETLNVKLPSGDANPGWVWLRTKCPEPTNLVATDLQVALSYKATGEEIAAGSTLCEFAKRLRGGIALDGAPNTDGRDCLPVDQTLQLQLDWSYGGLGDGETSLPVDVYARQCRHDAGTATPFEPRTPVECECPVPFYGISWVKIYTCGSSSETTTATTGATGTPTGTDTATPTETPTATSTPASTETTTGTATSTADPKFATDLECDCSLLGKLELDDKYADCGEPTPGISDNHIEPGTYNLFKDDDCEDTGYNVKVTDTRDKSGPETYAIAFEVTGDGDTPDPELCKVVIFAAGQKAVYSGEELGDPDNDTDGLLTAPKKEAK